VLARKPGAAETGTSDIRFESTHREGGEKNSKPHVQGKKTGGGKQEAFSMSLEPGSEFLRRGPPESINRKEIRGEAYAAGGKLWKDKKGEMEQTKRNQKGLHLATTRGGGGNLPREGGREETLYPGRT